jgi:hypothetical protein
MTAVVGQFTSSTKVLGDVDVAVHPFTSFGEVTSPAQNFVDIESAMHSLFKRDKLSVVIVDLHPRFVVSVPNGEALGDDGVQYPLSVCILQDSASRFVSAIRCTRISENARTEREISGAMNRYAHSHNDSSFLPFNSSEHLLNG